jgi:adenine-specific DNA-methyltransferase
MKQSVFEALHTVLAAAPYLASDGQTLLRAQLVADARAYKADLIVRLLSHPKIRQEFFVEAGSAIVFKADDFVRLLLGHEFLPSSFTSHANRIGLAIGGKYLKTIDDVVLDFPFKDCVLAGGQSRDEDARQELFYHEVMARDEISCLLEEKVFSKPVRVTEDGESSCDDFQDSDNLLIRGNNLVVLHSLKQRFKGKVKLIYIDPPYNTGSDSFKYNDRFNHATWMTFMKNRFEIAKVLLSNGGLIFVQLDDKEAAYCKVLMDEIFGRDFFVNAVSLATNSSFGFKSTSDGIFKQSNQILIYSKSQKPTIKNLYIEKEYDAAYNMVFDDISIPESKWKWRGIGEAVALVSGFTSVKEAKKNAGEEEFKEKVALFALKNAERVFQAAGVSGGAYYSGPRFSDNKLRW